MCKKNAVCKLKLTFPQEVRFEMSKDMRYIYITYYMTDTPNNKNESG